MDHPQVAIRPNERSALLSMKYVDDKQIKYLIHVPQQAFEWWRIWTYAFQETRIKIQMYPDKVAMGLELIHDKSIDWIQIIGKANKCYALIF